MVSNILDFKYKTTYNIGRYDSNASAYKEINDILEDGIGPKYEKWSWIMAGKSSVVITFLDETDYLWFILKYK